MIYKNKKIQFLLLMLAFLLLTSTACSFKQATHIPSKPTEVSHEAPATILSTANTVHPVEENHYATDPKSLGFVDNIMVVIVKEGVEENEILSWFPGEDATVAGRFKGLKQWQIRIQPRTYDELIAFADKLMDKEQVVYAHIVLAAFMAKEEPKKDEIEDTPKYDDGFWDEVFEYNEEFEGEDEDPLNVSKPADEWWYEAIGLREAQKLLNGKDLVKVGLADEGFDPSHPDLKLSFLNKEYKNSNGKLTEHGTNSAGVIQQILPTVTMTVGNNACPVGDSSRYMETQLQFIKYLVDMTEAGIKVHNYSIGSPFDTDAKLAWAEDFSAIASVYFYLLKQEGHDFIVVQSAGNQAIDAYRNGYYATLNEKNCLGTEKVRASLGVTNRLEEAQKTVFDSLIIAASCREKGVDSSEGYEFSHEWSNYGQTVTICAPGESIKTTYGGGYEILAGTSLAAPVVSGSLGLLWSMDKNLTSGELKALLLSTATEISDESAPGTNRRAKYPMLNLYEAAKQISKYNKR